jgi:hypothetical protein
MSEDLLALVHRFGSPNREERHEAIYDAYTYICHQSQTVYPESLATIDPLVALAVDPRCPGRADALKLLAAIAGSSNSEPGDYEAARSAVRRRLPDLMRSVTANPTPATVVALAQLVWSYPGDASVEANSLSELLQQFDEAHVVLAIALALQAHGDTHASFAFDVAFEAADTVANADAAAPDDHEPGRLGAALRALSFGRGIRGR